MEAAPETKLDVVAQPEETKMDVDQPKVDAPLAEEKEVEAEAAAPRRSSRRATTASASGNGAPKEKKAPAPKAAKKRSADDLAEEDTKPKAAAKKVKTANGAGEEEGLKLGEELPELTLKNEQGEDVKVQELAEGKKGVVLFLVPKADTPGCTTQACGFRDLSTDFTSLDFAVYCLSADAPDKQKKWKDKKSLPYPLISDPERSLIAKLTGGDKKTARSHFVFASGKLVEKRMPVKAGDSPRLALEFIRALQPGNTAGQEAKDAPDAADVAAASAAASVSIEPAVPSVPSAVAPDATTVGANGTEPATVTAEMVAPVETSTNVEQDGAGVGTSADLGTEANAEVFQG